MLKYAFIVFLSTSTSAFAHVMSGEFNLVTNVPIQLTHYPSEYKILDMFAVYFKDGKAIDRQTALASHKYCVLAAWINDQFKVTIDPQSIKFRVSDDRSGASSWISGTDEAKILKIFPAGLTCFKDSDRLPLEQVPLKSEDLNEALGQYISPLPVQ
jgi:hypothetical protein